MSMIVTFFLMVQWSAPPEFDNDNVTFLNWKTGSVGKLLILFARSMYNAARLHLYDINGGQHDRQGCCNVAARQNIAAGQ